MPSPQSKRIYSPTIHNNGKPLEAHTRLMNTSATLPQVFYLDDTMLSKPFTPRWSREEPMSYVDGVNQDDYDKEWEDNEYA